MQMLEVSRLRAGAVFHPSWGRGLIRVHMVHRPDVIVSFRIRNVPLPGYAGDLYEDYYEARDD